MNNTVYIYIEKTPNGAFRISGYDSKNGKDLYDFTFYDFTKREAIAAFRKHYDIKYRHADLVDFTKYKNNQARNEGIKNGKSL